jgi:glycerophosphoryl diester phosphodiesterase
MVAGVDRMREPFRLPPVIGHRGGACAAPENTLAAFRLAANHGASWVELDVRLSADGRCVVFHDETLKRVCGRSDRIDETTVAVLQGLDIGSWFDPAFADQTIPTLEQALGTLAELGLGAVIEIKPAPGAETRLTDGVLAALAGHWPAVVVSSFETEVIAKLKQTAPDVPRALNARRISRALLNRAKKLDCISLHLRHDRLRGSGVARVKSRGLQLAVWSVENAGRAGELWRWGVDSIITKSPDLILAAWRARERAF